MLKKTPVRGSDKVAVTFHTRDFEAADSVSLVGEFNAWDPVANPMRKRKDGAWAATVRLPNSGRFEYCFVIDGETWRPDEQADDLVPNPFGGQNSVVALP